MFTLFLLGLRWVLLSCLGPMLGFVGLSLAYLGTMLPPRGCFGPTGLRSLYFRFMLDHLGTMLGLCWVLLGRLGPMLAHLGTMLGVPGFYVGPSWLCVGLSWGMLRDAAT